VFDWIVPASGAWIRSFPDEALDEDTDRARPASPDSHHTFTAEASSTRCVVGHTQFGVLAEQRRTRICDATAANAVDGPAMPTGPTKRMSDVLGPACREAGVGAMTLPLFGGETTRELRRRRFISTLPHDLGGS
jgi:hypothetical protein